MTDMPDRTEPEHRRDLGIVGGVVVQLRLDFALGIIVDGVPGSDVYAELRIGSPFRYDTEGSSGTVDPEQTERLAPLLVLHDTTVDVAHVLDDGHLELRFHGTRTIIVPPDPSYEAWSATVTDRSTGRTRTLIGLPGSGTAEFDSP